MLKNRKILLAVLLLAGTGLGLALGEVSHQHQAQKPPAKAHMHATEDHQEKSMLIALTPAQIQKYDIQTVKINESDFQQKLSLPSEITLNENNVTHVAALVPGVVKAIYKNLGETVQANERLVSIQSREMAEAKAAYLAAFKDAEMKLDLFKREEKLWGMHVRAEIEYTKVKSILETAKIQLDQTKEKLLALGMRHEEVKQLLNQKEPLNIYDIDSPIDGVVIERHLTRGEVIDKDKQIFVLANLDSVWVTLTVGAKDLHRIHKGQKVTVFSQNDKMKAASEIMYVSPIINEESRSGKAIVELENVDKKWHPGDFVTTEIALVENMKGDIFIPASAVQKIQNDTYVFVRNQKGFLAKKMMTHETKDNDFVQVRSGLEIGDEIATTNTFLLKAELGKSEAEHTH